MTILLCIYALASYPVMWILLKHLANKSWNAKDLCGAGVSLLLSPIVLPIACLGCSMAWIVGLLAKDVY